MTTSSPPDDLWQQVFLRAPEQVTIVDADLVCRLCNDAVTEKTGFAREDVIGSSLCSVIDREDREAVEAAASAALADPGPPRSVEFRAIYADGSWHHLDASMRGVDIGDERLIVFTSRDVTVERETARALARKNDLEILLDRVQQAFINVMPADTDAILGWALEETAVFLGADRGYVLSYDLEARTETMTHEWCAEGVTPEIDSYRETSFDLVPHGVHTSLSGEVIALSDVAAAAGAWTDDARFLHESGIVSLLEFPIVIGGHTLGSLGFDWLVERATWSDDDLPVLGMFAAAFANLLDRRESERHRHELSEQLRRGFERSPAPLAVVDRWGVLLQVNDELCTLVGHPSAALLGEFAGVLLRPEYMEACLAWGAEIVAIETGPYPSIEAELRTGHGREVWVEIRPQAVRVDGEIEQFVVQAVDVTARKRAQNEVARQEARFATLVQNLPDPVIRVDEDLKVTFHNAAGGSLIEDFVLAKDADGHARMYREVGGRAFTEDRMQTAVFEFDMQDGTRIYEGRFLPEPFIEGQPRSMLLVGSDLTERLRSEDELAHRASHDPLTDLPNRTMFLSHLDRALDDLARARRKGADRRVVAVIFFDLDRFKVVNDSLGHAAGDELLQAIAARLGRQLRADDVVARLGGDEFIVLLSSCSDTRSVGETAGRLLDAITEPIEVAGRELVISGSAGVAIASQGDESADELMRWADAAMYQAKDHGRACVVMFDDVLAEEVRQRFELDQELRQAAERGEFEVWFQPEIDLETGDIVGAEALVRWRTPQGIRAAGEFIWLAEETGLIVPIGNWVLDEACQWAARWHREDRPLTIRVNLSARQFDQTDLVGVVSRALQRSGLPAAQLCLEITETALMANAEASREMLLDLDELGVELAIDDFGTGYSSLSYLKQFPVDVLKIDRTFVDGLPDDSEDSAIVTTIILLANALGMTVTAEGIETGTQAAMLVALGCRRGQGFHYARPMPAEELQARLEQAETLQTAVSRIG